MSKAALHYREQTASLEEYCELTTTVLNAIAEKGFIVPNLQWPLTPALLHTTVNEMLSDGEGTFESYVFSKSNNSNIRLCLVMTSHTAMTSERVRELVDLCTQEHITQLMIVSTAPLRAMTAAIRHARDKLKVWWIPAKDVLRNQSIGRSTNKFAEFLCA